MPNCYKFVAIDGIQGNSKSECAVQGAPWRGCGGRALTVLIFLERRGVFYVGFGFESGVYFY